MSLNFRINLAYQRGLKTLHKDKNFQLNVESKISSEKVTVIFGPSGCGKTTLLRCLAGLEKNLDAEISFNQINWQQHQNKLATERRSIGYVFQQANLFEHLNVRQNLHYGLKRSQKNQPGNSKTNFSFEHVVDLMGLSDLLNQATHSLSGGEKQRVAIARAILSHPKILFMDEPLTALDQKSKQQILPYIEKINQAFKLPIIYVTHSEEEVARLADDLIIMQAGQIKGQGNLLSMLANLDSPLTELDSCFSLLDCVVSQINQQQALVQLSFDGLKLRLPISDLSIGQKVRVRVLAKDVSLCLTPPTDSSILNILPAVISAIKADDTHAVQNTGQCLVSLKVAGRFINARISDYSKHQLQLKPGLAVYVQIKAIALIRR